ncbi:MAG TPA: DUF4870 domain-containing protein [Candidatus Omnitrophica bacterium]|nr:DUF4870 domain-containing protein [Candidatus Omnitrophota bacterium]
MQENPLVKSDNERKSRIWATLCHLTALLGLIGIPFGHILGPFVIWLLKKNEYPFVNEQGKESLNFQLTMTIFTAIAILLIFIKIGFFLIFGLVMVNLILVIIASIKVSNGEHYQYPFKIRIIK